MRVLIDVKERQTNTTCYLPLCLLALGNDQPACKMREKSNTIERRENVRQNELIKRSFNSIGKGTFSNKCERHLRGKNYFFEGENKAWEFLILANHKS